MYMYYNGEKTTSPQDSNSNLVEM